MTKKKFIVEIMKIVIKYTLQDQIKDNTVAMKILEDINNLLENEAFPPKAKK